MNNIEKIKLIQNLEEKKLRLEKELDSIHNDILEVQEECEHVVVFLGYHGWCAITGEKYRCLLCGKEDIYEPNFIIDAKEYLKNYDVKIEHQFNNKFDHIQTIALGLLKDNPDMTGKELLDKLNNLIQESIEYKENQSGPKLTKSMNPKNI